MKCIIVKYILNLDEFVKANKVAIEDRLRSSSDKEMLSASVGAGLNTDDAIEKDEYAKIKLLKIKKVASELQKSATMS